MATFTLQRDEMKTCPYNPLHKVAARRLQAHIIKCSRNPANPVLVDCPFNALHKVPPQELQHHILLCKDSRQVIREIEESRNRPVSRPVDHGREVPVSTEDWADDDERGSNYVVPGLVRDSNGDIKGSEDTDESFTLKSNIEIQGMKPSERKKYYKQLVEKAKSKELPEMKSEIRFKEEKEMSFSSGHSSRNEWEGEDHPSNVRRPTTIPSFKTKMIGIGRGNTPLANRSPSLRSVDLTIKRENSDDSYHNRKRFSPDSQ